MRHFFGRRVRAVERMLIVESGSRQILEAGIPRFRAVFGDGVQVDLLTCLPGLPQALKSTARAFRVTECRTNADRRRLLLHLRAMRHPVLGIICSDEPVMTPWKLAAMALLPARVVIFNENGDFFWLDWRHRRAIRQFLMVRAGLMEEDAARKIFQLAAFPVALVFLLLYAGWVHLARGLRLALGGLRRSS